MAEMGQQHALGLQLHDGSIAPIADLPFLLLVMESAEAEPFRQPGRGWPS
jgi:hypothetical protein